ncbi:MAG: excinuclease ABC subunit UvrC [Acidiferrobacterales bacterium]|nr:excinuclease ABC subunit UvrC [Acidiferrobacterales bacterium]
MDLSDPKAFVRNLPNSPGVYRMISEDNKVIYVGKARNLKKRVASYFRASGLSPKNEAMMQLARAIEITVTHTENEALLLENNLIKAEHPRFNILLRDDKSYPYLYLSTKDEYPRLDLHRGAQKKPGRYFGPYPSVTAVRESMNLLQKTFGIRQCNDSFFRARSRPCLQYQIKRCSGPCVGLIDKETYANDIRHVVMFLEGKSHAMVEEMILEMERASESQDYEKAAIFRDRIAALKRTQEKQYVNSSGGNIDIMALAVEKGLASVEVMFVRDGRQLGSRSYFPQRTEGADEDDILSAFLSQYYIGKPVPATIYVDRHIADTELLQAALVQQADHGVKISIPSRGKPRRWLEMTEVNARDALRRQLISRSSLRQRFEALQEALGLDAVPERIECFDISHTQGEATVGSCVVFSLEGPVKSDYRRFNIEGIQAGDDYAAMTQALTRRYRRMKEGEGKWPDIVLIDGGKGQLSRAEEVMRELQVREVKLIGVAKGPGRKPGLEQLFLSGQKLATILPADSPALHLIQQVRDEAHRFAIAGHRHKRGKARRQSRLEEIPGIGEKRRQSLLKRLGGLQEVARAGVEDLASVPGISPDLAKKIYDVFHSQDS